MESNTQQLLVFVHYNISKMEIFPVPSSTLGEIDMCPHGLFCMDFNVEQLLFQYFFDVMRIFGSIEPQTESTFSFLYIIIFQR